MTQGLGHRVYDWQSAAGPSCPGPAFANGVSSGHSRDPPCRCCLWLLSSGSQAVCRTLLPSQRAGGLQTETLPVWPPLGRVAEPSALQSVYSTAFLSGLASPPGDSSPFPLPPTPEPSESPEVTPCSENGMLGGLWGSRCCFMSLDCPQSGSLMAVSQQSPPASGPCPLCLAALSQSPLLHEEPFQSAQTAPSAAVARPPGSLSPCHWSPPDTPFCDLCLLVPPEGQLRVKSVRPASQCLGWWPTAGLHR